MWLVLLILVGFAIFWVVRWRRQAAVKRWRNALALDKHQAVFQQLYADLNGFILSQTARSGQDAIEYVYGEIDFESFIALVSLCTPNSSTLFYDLGSGIGKAVLACAMVFDIKKSCGIEFFPSLHQNAELQRQRLRKIPDYLEKADRIEFRQGDFLEAQFNDASLIFINATAFFGETWLAISKHVEQVKPGTQVISTSKTLRSNLFITSKVTQVTMSWGIVDAFIQERLATDSAESVNLLQ